MAKATRKATPRPLKITSDRALINECVIYAQSIAALHQGFTADPNGDSAHASHLGEKHGDRARLALARLAATPSYSPDSLCAKARIVPMVFQDHPHGALEVDAADFIRGFAAEVKRFLQPICDGNVRLDGDTPGRKAERETDERIRKALS